MLSTRFVPVSNIAKGPSSNASPVNLFCTNSLIPARLLTFRCSFALANSGVPDFSADNCVFNKGASNVISAGVRATSIFSVISPVLAAASLPESVSIAPVYSSPNFLRSFSLAFVTV